MSKTHETKRGARRAAQARQKLYSRIIISGLGIIALVTIVWLVITSMKPQQAAGQPSSSSLTALPPQEGPTPELVGTKQYAYAPPMIINMTKQYSATVLMAKGGEFVIQLYPEKAPITVNSFVFLASQGYFDGVSFHRVLEGFMAQGGDPTGSGGGGPGYSFVNEANDLKFDKAGVVAMANSGPDTNGSQFFIMFGPYGLSESDYTIFGQVISGMDVVNGLTQRDPTLNPTFNGDLIKSITITEK